MRNVIPDNDGRIFVLHVTDPGAGGYVEIGPPAGERWRLISVTCTFTTSAAVANRQVSWRCLEALYGTICFCGIFSTIQVASLVRGYHFMDGQSQAPYDISGVFMGGLPTGIRLVYGLKLIIDAINLQAADAFTNIYVVAQKWIDPEIIV